MKYKYREAKCPQCGMKMIVLEHVLTGIDIDDDRIGQIEGEKDINFFDY